ncbi:MAG: hypothetical protein ACI87O_002576 [Planctomycetota bacterium]|jgi:hypothetical protein
MAPDFFGSPAVSVGFNLRTVEVADQLRIGGKQNSAGRVVGCQRGFHGIPECILAPSSSRLIVGRGVDLGDARVCFTLDDVHTAMGLGFDHGKV